MAERKYWTDQEEKLLLDNINLDADELAKLLHRSKWSVVSKLRQMKPVDSSKDRTAIYLPEPRSQQQKLERIYIMAHRVGSKILRG